MKVVNIRDYGSVAAAKKVGAVYIGRGSPLGNPFSHLRFSRAIYTVATREEAINCYRKWLHTQLISGNKDVINALEELSENSVLVCFCSPKPCHGNIIVKAWHWWNDRPIVETCD